MNSIRVVFFVAFMSMLFAAAVAVDCSGGCPTITDGCITVDARCSDCSACAVLQGESCNSNTESCKSDLVCVDENNIYYEGPVPEWAMEFVGTCKTQDASMTPGVGQSVSTETPVSDSIMEIDS